MRKNEYNSTPDEYNIERKVKARAEQELIRELNATAEEYPQPDEYAQDRPTVKKTATVNLLALCSAFLAAVAGLVVVQETVSLSHTVQEEDEQNTQEEEEQPTADDSFLVELRGYGTDYFTFSCTAYEQEVTIRIYDVEENERTQTTSAGQTETVTFDGLTPATPYEAEIIVNDECRYTYHLLTLAEGQTDFSDITIDDLYFTGTSLVYSVQFDEEKHIDDEITFKVFDRSDNLLTTCPLSESGSSGIDYPEDSDFLGTMITCRVTCKVENTEYIVTERKLLAEDWIVAAYRDVEFDCGLENDEVWFTVKCDTSKHSEELSVVIIDESNHTLIGQTSWKKQSEYSERFSCAGHTDVSLCLYGYDSVHDPEKPGYVLVEKKKLYADGEDELEYGDVVFDCNLEDNTVRFTMSCDAEKHKAEEFCVKVVDNNTHNVLQSVSWKELSEYTYTFTDIESDDVTVNLFSYLNGDEDDWVLVVEKFLKAEKEESADYGNIEFECTLCADDDFLLMGVCFYEQAHTGETFCMTVKDSAGETVCSDAVEVEWVQWYGNYPFTAVDGETYTATLTSATDTGIVTIAEKTLEPKKERNTDFSDVSLGSALNKNDGTFDYTIFLDAEKHKGEEFRLVVMNADGETIVDQPEFIHWFDMALTGNPTGELILPATEDAEYTVELYNGRYEEEPITTIKLSANSEE